MQQLPIVGRIKGVEQDDSKLKKVKEEYDGKWNFDYSKGMVWQVMQAKFTMEDYYDFLEKPKTLVNPWRTVRLFDNPIMEFVTQGPWQQTPFGFGPYSLYLLYLNDQPFLPSLLAYVMGMFTWGFSEYFLHRFVFHGEQTWVPDNHIAIALHFFMNGNHHAFPQDPNRLTFPFIPCCLVLYLFGFLPLSYVVPTAYYNVFMSGWLLAYIIFEMLHYISHFASTKNPILVRFKELHSRHHYW